MAVVQRIASVSEIPSGQKHVLVTIGHKSELTRQGDNVLFTVDQTLPDNLFEAHTERVVSDAELLAEQERIDTVFVCIPSRRGK